jgi:peptidoglycan-associated lipoprotein
VDVQCKAGFVCQQNKCVPKPECANDSACTAGQHCKEGKCTNACVTDAECGKGKCRNNQCMNTCTKKSDCAEGEDCQEGVCTLATTAGCSWEPIHFGFNDSTLTSDSQARLSALVECVKASRQVRLEGFADERGTEEYNLHLSNRRAASVKKYLVDLGVPAQKLSTVGFGANRPAVQGHNEEAWAANRRVEFKH